MKNTWFKHYNTASEGHTLRTLLDNGDLEAYAMFWVLHELISKFENNDARGKVTLAWRTLARAMNWKPSKCVRVLVRISAVSQLQFIHDMDGKPEGNVTVLSPNWLELQENRGGKREANNEQKKSKKPIEVRSKKKDVYPRVELEKLFELYPKRKGSTEKEVGLERLSRIVDSPEAFQQVKTAIENYAAHCKADGKIGTEFVSMFSTFVGRKKLWLEWAEARPTKPKLEIKTEVVS
jgi:hypothetical protein